MTITKTKNKKGYGALGALLIGIISLFVVGLFYIMITPAFLSTTHALNDTELLMNDTDAQATITKIFNVWYLLPLLIIVFIIIFVIAQAFREEPYNYYK